MKKWKDIAAFIEWANNEKNMAIDYIDHYMWYDNAVYDDPMSKINIARKNSNVDIARMETIVDSKILEYLNSYFSELDLFFIKTFIFTIDEVRYFDKSSFSNDASDFKDEIDRLKKKANELQFFSGQQIIISLPVLPQISIFSMIDSFRKYNFKDETIKDFHRYFEEYHGRQRMPSKTKAHSKRMDNFNKIWHQYNKPLSEEEIINSGLNRYMEIGLKEEDIISFIGMSVAADQLHTYKPDMRLRYVSIKKEK